MLKAVATAAACLAAASLSFAAGTTGKSINGNYIEARTADVYTGPCFANGEAEQVGREAVFGWQISKGEWRGVNLSGLSVVGVIRTPHTIGLTSEPVNPAKAVLIVDQKADPEQRLALMSFAKEMSGDLLKDVVKVDYAPIALTLDNGSVHSGGAKLTAGALAEIRTRAMSAADHICGNEDIWYEPLTKLDHVMPAYTLENSYTGDALGETWHNRFKRSGFVGTFQVPAE